MKRSAAIIIVAVLLALGGICFLSVDVRWSLARPDGAYAGSDEGTSLSDLPSDEGGASQTDVNEESAERGYAVSTSSDLATDVGMAVLAAGGNAVDAAVAVAYALAVVEPFGSGLGGGGGLLVYDSATDVCVFYDYRACAGSTTNSYDNIAVPGFVAGMEAVHGDYGTIPLSDLIEPAADYAEDGITVNAQLSYRLSVAKSSLSSYPWLHDEDGDLLTEGDTMYQPQLAEVLRAIQAEGAEVFYEGWIAEDIAAGTSLTVEDLAGYQVYERAAVEGYFEGHTVYGAAAPLSGVTLIQMLELADELDIADPLEDPLTYLSQLKQITSLAYGARYSTIGDPAFYEIDEQQLVSRGYILGLLGLSYAEEGYDLDEESAETTSFSIVDADGLVVVATNTLTRFFGSRVAVDGIFMNNTNANFSASGINVYEPGKRSRTFTAPTIITGDDGYVLAVGTPGGNNIPSRLFTVIVDILKFGEDPQAAVDKAGVLYRNGALTIEIDGDGETWIDTSGVTESIVWKKRGVWWGCISLAGWSEEQSAFSAYDSRRGATRSGAYEP